MNGWTLLGDIDPLRQHDLEDVPGRNVLARGLDHLQVALSGRVRDLPLLGGTVRKFAADRHRAAVRVRRRVISSSILASARS